MKVFQILNDQCWWDASSLYASAEEAATHYAPDIVFADAPDDVQEGWGFDETKEGDARFIAPPEPEPEPEPVPDPQDDTDAMLVDHELRITMLELGLE